MWPNRRAVLLPAAVCVLYAVSACNGAATRGRGPMVGEGSLRGAMDALLTRQRQMSAAANRQYMPDMGDAGQWIAQQGPQEYGNAMDEIQYYPSRFEKTPNYPFYDREPGSYRQSPLRDHAGWNHQDKRGTSFRERMSRVKPHARDELAELFLKNIQEDEARERLREREQERNEEYEEMVDDMFQRYRNKDYEDPEQDLARIFGGRNEVKRQLAGDYQPVGWGPVGFRKRAFRERYDDDITENDLMRALKYIPAETLERLLSEENGANNDLQILNQMPHYNNYAMYSNKGHEQIRKKRFPVTKRSNVIIGNKKKRSSELENPATETEEKISRDLSSIFGSQTKKSVTEDKNKKIKIPVKKSDKLAKIIVEKHNATDGHDHTHYGEVVKPEQILPEKPVEIKKKAVNWSDYFGIDKRSKKSFPDDREEWIKHKYLANSMREYNNLKQNEYPLRSFKNHDLDKKYYQPFDTRIFVQGQEQNTDTENGPDYEDVDEKLKDIEDILLDEAAKYTEAREADPEEINQLRQMVISRLSEMYDNDKQYQPSGFRNNFPGRNHNDFVDDKAKRVAVKKENADHAHNETNETNDDKEKRSFGNQKVSQEPYSEGYMGGRLGFPHNYDAKECPIIQSIVTRCRNIDLWAGDRAHVFLPLCSMHQICYLCGPTGAGGCDMLYLSEADSVCSGASGERECKRVARDALALMRELHAAPDPAAECARHPCLAEFKRKR